MIAFAREYHEEQPDTPAWHAGFLQLLPALRDQLRFLLRKLSADERYEATAECVAHVTLAYVKLFEQGKLDLAYPSSLATYAVKHYFAGRRIGTPLNVDDVTSPWAQKQRGFRVRSLDRRAPNGEWKEVVAEDGRATPAEVGTARLDIEAWLDELPRLKRGIAEPSMEPRRNYIQESIMPNTETAQLYVEVEFDPAVTDAESLATAMDRLMETALSTPDIMSDYGNPAVKEFYAVGKQPTRYVASVQVVDPDSQAPVTLEIRKTEGGYLVGIDGSYLEQDVGPVYDPCNFGVELEIPEDEDESAIGS